MIYKNIKSYMESYFTETQDVKLDINAWVWLDFKTKRARWGSVSDGSLYEVPATLEEYLAFMKYFFSKGIKECWFRELKEYVTFYGRTARDRKYYCVITLDAWRFRWLLKQQEKVSAIFGKIVSKSEKYKEQSDKKRNSHQNATQTESISDFFMRFAKFLENDAKMQKYNSKLTEK